MQFHRLPHVLGTCGVKAAGARQHGRKEALIPYQGHDDEAAHRSNTCTTSASTSSNGNSPAMRRGLNTRLHPVGKRPKEMRTASRTRLRMRLRRFALPNARGVVNPARVGPSSSRRRQKATKLRLDSFRPESYTSRNSFRLRILRSLPKDSSWPDAEDKAFAMRFLMRTLHGALITNGELPAATRTPAGKHRPPVLGCHASAEPVGLGALAVIWLKRPFRHFFLAGVGCSAEVDKCAIGLPRKKKSAGRQNFILSCFPKGGKVRRRGSVSDRRYRRPPCYP